MKRAILILFIPVFLFARNSDSLSIEVLTDSLLASVPDSSSITDSLALPDSVGEKSGNDIDAVVFANAKDSLKFDVQKKEMYLYGEGDIKYKKTELKSGNIIIDFETSDLVALGREEVNDSAGTTAIVETPVLKEESDTYEGASIKYNFKTQQGFISMAKNAADSKTYYGEKVKKISKKTFFIQNGKFTTCDADTPHYYFSASKMKVIQGEQIIAKWIFMYIGGVPLPIPLPWGVFPNKTGRASGIIAPSYGNNADQGWYLRNMGYFYVINDYADATLTGDYYFKGGYGLRGRLRYKKRYSFTGNINGGFSNEIRNEKGDPDYSKRFEWNVNVTHNQKINPTTQLDIRLKFMSSDYLKYNSPNINDLVTQEIISNATFTKRWEGSGTNLTVNYHRVQNLGTGDVTEDLPNLTFTKSRAYPFQKKSGSGKDKKWYEFIGYDYSGKFRNNRQKKSDESTTHGGFDHTINISASPKIGHFNISPSFRLNSKWYNKRQMQGYDSKAIGNGIDSLFYNQYDVNEFNTVNTFNFNLTASTKLYGMAQPQMLGVAAFRHTFEPRITYSYNPDFSTEFWGYYDSFVDTTGQIIRYDKFGNQIFGGVASGKVQRFSLSLGNIFEIKTMKDPSDTTSKQQKIKLMDLGISTGYNFAADSLNMDNININFRTQVGRILNLHGNTILSPYNYYHGRQINSFIINESGIPLKLTGFNLNISSSLSADIFKSKEDEKKKENDEEGKELIGNGRQSSDYIELYRDEEPDFSIPWNLSLTYNYNYTNHGVGYVNDRSNLGADLSFNLTKKWKFTFSGSYDITNKKMNAPQITIYRDLHAWEAHMEWRPIGAYKGFRFEIRLKAPEFRDLKVTKTKNIYSRF